MSFKEAPRPNPDSAMRRNLDEVTERVRAEEKARMEEFAARTAQLRQARLAREQKQG
jgi:muconolactone delta-isomerase